EWVHVQLHQQKGMISLSPPTICNSAVKNTHESFSFRKHVKATWGSWLHHYFSKRVDMTRIQE
ncbi:hypothetical protein M8B82_23690, partial [Enterobacter hormaechei subsp. xiangfangensis]|uniref:hypothetical protein n=1 Tax=Enterobacter hormaechei TaxID=158836 RepID=UPI0022372B80